MNNLSNQTCVVLDGGFNGWYYYCVNNKKLELIANTELTFNFMWSVRYFCLVLCYVLFCAYFLVGLCLCLVVFVFLFYCFDWFYIETKNCDYFMYSVIYGGGEGGGI